MLAGRLIQDLEKRSTPQTSDVKMVPANRGDKASCQAVTTDSGPLTTGSGALRIGSGAGQSARVCLTG